MISLKIIFLIARGMISFDDDGWIDGARLEKSNLSKWAKQMAITVGRIDQLNEPSALSRGIGAPNVIQIHVQGEMSKRLSYLVEGTHFDPKTAQSEQHLRTAVKIATKDVLSFVDNFVVESLIRSSKQPLQGFGISAQSTLSETWSLKSEYSYKRKNIRKLQ